MSRQATGSFERTSRPSLKSQTEQPGNSFKYFYWRLAEKQFQQLCAALLRNKYDPVQCYPVGMADRGIDSIATRSTIFQVKWTSKFERSPHTWLKSALDGERKNIEKLVASGKASRYIMMTSVAGTTTAQNTGSLQKLDTILSLYSEEFGIPFECWWQSDIDAEVDLAPDALKWAYPEMLAGIAAIHYLMHGSAAATDAANMRESVREVVKSQWTEDARVRFSQVDMGQVPIADVFVDVRGDVEYSPEPADVPNNIRRYVSFHRTASQDQPHEGAVQRLAHSTFPLSYILGVPGQGKSTLGQYLAQLHRAAVLDISDYGDPPIQADKAKLPLRIDLKDYASWLSGNSPFEAEQAQASKPRQPRIRSIETFLAEFCSYNSGGRTVTVEQVHSLLERYPTLLIFDGLDEIASVSLREDAVYSIDKLAKKMALTRHGRSFQIIVTSRPNAAGLAEPDPSIFETVRLEPLDSALQKEFVAKWAGVHQLGSRERRKLMRIFENRASIEHISQLADNPMQLTILLYLISRKGDAVPLSRTPLYTDYMQTLLDREVDNGQIDQSSIERVKEATSFLGWYMHSGVEETADAGRMPKARIEDALILYFRRTNQESVDPTQLFTAVTDRFWALTSKFQGTFEFAVQPVREYFAARFLAEWSGQDRRDPISKLEVLRCLIDRPYWLNVARFYAGFANPNEIAGLRYGLEDALSDGKRPLQERVSTWALLLDGIFVNKEAMQRDVVALLADDLTLKLIEADTERPTNFPRLGSRVGGSQFAELLLAKLQSDPEAKIARAATTTLRRHLPMRNQDFLAWWTKGAQNEEDTDRLLAWMEIGAIYGLREIGRIASDKFKDLPPEAFGPALEIGIDPTPGESASEQLVAAVTNGWCSDSPTSSKSEAGALLRAMRPQWFLQAHSTAKDGPTTPNEFLWVSEGDRADRTAAWRDLRKLGDKYSALQQACRGGVGQNGTTERWQRPATALCDIFGPNWLSSEISIIGALPDRDIIGSGTFRKGSDPLGPYLDYGTLILELKRHHEVSWWQKLYRSFGDDRLSAMTWLLAIAAIASDRVITAAIEDVEACASRLSELDFSTVATAASRIGISSGSRTLKASSIIPKLTTSSERVAQLLCPFISSVGEMDPLQLLPEERLLAMVSPKPYAWPAFHAVSARLMRRPTKPLLDGLRRAGHRSWSPAHSVESWKKWDSDTLEEVLRFPADFPSGWVVAAEQARAISAVEMLFSEETASKGWTPEVPRM